MTIASHFITSVLLQIANSREIQRFPLAEMLQISLVFGGNIPLGYKGTYVVADLDGTIIVRDFNNYRPLAPVVERIKQIGIPVCLYTNQGGISFRIAHQRPEKNYPDWPQTVERIRYGMRVLGVRFAFVALYHPAAKLPSGHDLEKEARAIGLPVVPPKGFVLRCAEGYICASWNPEWRKPPGAVLKLLSVFSPLVFVGDEESDRESAVASGVRFLSVEEITGNFYWVEGKDETSTCYIWSGRY